MLLLLLLLLVMVVAASHVGSNCLTNTQDLLKLTHVQIRNFRRPPDAHHHLEKKSLKIETPTRITKIIM